MERNLAQQFEGLRLGAPQDLPAPATPHFLRLIAPPFPFEAEDFQELLRKIRDKQEESDWEIIPRAEKDDSYLGQIDLAVADGHDRDLSRILYRSDDRYILFRATSKALQPFKKLEYRPAKGHEIQLGIDSVELVPFRAGIAFLSVALSNAARRDVPFRAAIDANYYLPFLGSRALPLVQTKRLRDRSTREIEHTVPALIQCAWESAFGKTDESGKFTKIGDCANSRVRKPEIAGSKSRLFAMSYAISAAENQEWEGADWQAARRHYHQLTRWPQDEYIHDIEPAILREGPERTLAGLPTRSCAFADEGVTCIGLGASEFERNNYLPKFRESYFFALLLAWHMKAGLQAACPDPEWRRAVETFPFEGLFNKEPRRQFFLDCLKFYRIDSSPQSQGQLPSLPASPDPETDAAEQDACVFLMQGEYWQIVYEGQEIHMKDSKGLQHIAYLLRYPGREIGAIDLYHRSQRTPAPASAIGHEDAGETDMMPARGSREKTGEEEAIQDYRKTLGELSAKMAELLEDREEAKANNDLAALERLDGEIGKAEEDIEAIQKALKETEGSLLKSKRGGRGQEDPEEKARKAVSRAIELAREKIREEHEALHRHLKDSIRLGLKCCYRPDKPTHWDCQG